MVELYLKIHPFFSGYFIKCHCEEDSGMDTPVGRLLCSSPCPYMPIEVPPESTEGSGDLESRKVNLEKEERCHSQNSGSQIEALLMEVVEETLGDER